MIDKHKYNNFGYLSTKFYLKGNDNPLPLTVEPFNKTKLNPSLSALCNLWTAL